MTDVVDVANDTAQLIIERAIASRQQFVGESLTECADCGDPIPEQRLKALKMGVKRCAGCQNELEQKGVRA